MNRYQADLENTDFIMDNTFWIGAYPEITDQLIDHMAKTVVEAMNK